MFRWRRRRQARTARLTNFSPFILHLTKGPKGPEPALGFFEKNGLSHFGREAKQNNNKSFRPTSPGVARTFLRYYYVDVTFSFTLRSRSGREAHRGSRFKDPGRHFPVPYLISDPPVQSGSVRPSLAYIEPL
jgi:hypothetical protein